MFETKAAPWTRRRCASSCIAQSTASGSRTGESPMRSANDCARLGAARRVRCRRCACLVGTAIAGGPLLRRAVRRHAAAGAMGRHGQGLHGPGHARRAQQRGGQQARAEHARRNGRRSPTSSFRARDRRHAAVRHHRRQRRPGHRRQQWRRYPGHLRQRRQRHRRFHRRGPRRAWHRYARISRGRRLDADRRRLGDHPRRRRTTRTGVVPITCWANPSRAS